MNNIFIATRVEDAKETNLHRSLPLFWTTIQMDAAFRVTESYSPDVIDSKLFNHGDLVVSYSLDNDKAYIGNNLSKNIGSYNLQITRHKKSITTAWFNTIADRLGLKAFRKIETHNNEMKFNFKSSGFYVLKSEFGANGHNQIVFDPKAISLNHVLNTVAECTGDLAKELEDSPFVKSGQLTLINYKPSEDDNPNDFYSTQGYCVQEHIPSIKSEFRIIIGPDNEVVYCLKRERKEHPIQELDVNYYTASGRGVGVDKSSSTLDAELLPFKKEFDEILNQADFALYSFDLFTTDDNHWGIFEISPECGISSVPNGLLTDLACDYIEVIAKKCDLI